MTMSTSKRGFPVLFSADFHGNRQQYAKFFEEAVRIGAKAVILGGDLTPKDPQSRTVAGQREFLEQTLFHLLDGFHRQMASTGSTCKVFLLLGNDDFRSNEHLLHQTQERHDFTVIHGRRVPLTDSVELVGYSHVPATPFTFKDWEKPDAVLEDERETRPGLRIWGVRSDGEVLRRYRLSLEDRKAAIEAEVSDLLETRRRTILVSHAPPFKTPLDVTWEGEHVGSRGIRTAIEKYQPELTLHGHIHETVESSGAYVTKIGDTTCASVGNDHSSPGVYVLSFDAIHPALVQRRLLT